jgi:hypothetical protein
MRPAPSRRSRKRGPASSDDNRPQCTHRLHFLGSDLAAGADLARSKTCEEPSWVKNAKPTSCAALLSGWIDPTLAAG